MSPVMLLRAKDMPDLMACCARRNGSGGGGGGVSAPSGVQQPRQAFESYGHYMPCPALISRSSADAAVMLAVMAACSASSRADGRPTPARIYRLTGGILPSWAGGEGRGIDFKARRQSTSSRNSATLTGVPTVRLCIS
jgi:hypothetical protein